MPDTELNVSEYSMDLMPPFIPTSGCPSVSVLASSDDLEAAAGIVPCDHAMHACTI